MKSTKKKVPWHDPIVGEIRRNWEKYAKKFDFDLEKIYLDLKRQEEETEGQIVSFIREPATATSPPAAPAHPSKRRDT